MVLLAVESENGVVLNYRFEKSQITVGSSSRNDVVVRSPAVADRHLVMHRNGDLFTFVTVDRQTVVLNGERRSRGVLYPGDRVRLGPMTLVFRGSEGASGDDIAQVGASEPPAAAATVRDEASPMAFLSDPAGFATTRSELVAALATPRSDCFRTVVALIREALPSAELAVLAPDGGGGMAALASVWEGNLPRFSPAGLSDLRTPGRYAQIGSGGSAAVIFPISAPDGEAVGAIAARPAGMLGNEGVALLGETARLLGLRWREIGRADAIVPGWDADAQQTLGTRIPGTSQAVQVLRAGMLAAAVGNDPVLVCGGEGVGRTETARLLASLGPSRGRPVVVVDGGDGDERAARRELFGPTGVPSLADRVEGAISRARGGVLILRNADRLPVSLQAELAGLISAQQRETAGAGSVRWVLTCGEDPLALVQQGKFEPTLFLVFSRRMLRVPRLAERREDLPLLIANMLTRVAQEQKKNVRGITLECLNTLLVQPFPGEMAELVEAINRFVTATPDGEMVRCEELSGSGEDAVTRGSHAVTDLADVLASDNLKQVVPRVEQLIIDRVMRQVKGNQSKGARALGISRGALIAKLKEYAVPDYRFLRRRQRKV
jgi:DNA-binding NtrC family response regulator